MFGINQNYQERFAYDAFGALEFYRQLSSINKWKENEMKMSRNEKNKMKR